MRAFLFTIAVLLGFGLLLSVDRPSTGMRGTPQTEAAEPLNVIGSVGVRTAASSIASYPDRGELLAYDHKRQVLHSGASTWQPVQISEQHALRAIAEGGMKVRAPNGEIIHLRYERHVEHPDGNWTWVGREDGSAPGTETLLTFGDKAVFGTIRQGSADLSLTTEAGSTWLVETDYSRVDHNRTPVNDDDFLVAAGEQEPMARGVPDRLQAASHAELLAARVSAVEATALVPTTVDIAMGFTTGFATRLGGESQARTRLHFLVDVANQAYVASGINNAQIRLVHAVQVNYPDGTHNDSALFDLTGVECTEATNGAQYRSSGRFDCTAREHPAALQPLVAARGAYGADLLVLVRKFEASSTSCGVAWMLGGGQNPITSSSAAFGMSVVNDSSGDMFPDNGVTCPDLSLAHELGHNMGQQHDVVTASGSDDSDSNGDLLDPEEYGHHPYSFGYSTDGTSADIATIMSNRRESQHRYRVFANPLISSCGGAPCGTPDQADNARSMAQTMPILAAFRVRPASTRSDFDGDGRSDLLWRSSSNGANVLWKGASVGQSLATVVDQNWVVVGIGDFGGDGLSDIVWRHATTGANAIWHAGTTGQNLAKVADASWKIVGVGDFDGDGRSDLLWRNSINGANVLWKSGTVGQVLTTVADQNWKVVAIGDFDGNGRSDIVWRHMATGANEIWKGGDSSAKQTLSTVAALSWNIVGASDFDGDGRADLLWRNSVNGANTLWKAATVGQTLTSLPDQSWQVAATGDYNGDGKSDIMWRNRVTGANQIWNSANSATPRSLSTVSLNWKVVPSTQ